MKKIILCFLSLASILCFAACGKDMNYIISNESSVIGTVKEMHRNSLLMENKNGEYFVSLDVECGDSMTDFSEGDEIYVYYDGNIAETYPMQINKVYAIVLKTPANRSENNVS